MYIRLFILQLILAVTCNGFIVKDGNCSLVTANLSVVKDFDLQKFLGKWFEIERYEQDYLRNLECVTIEYGQGVENQSIELKVKGLLPEKNASESFSQTAQLSDPTSNSLEGKLNVSFGAKFGGYSDYWVMETDYTNFAVIYSCTPFVDASSVIEGYWLLSRTPKLSEDTQTVEKLKVLQNAYFIPDHIRATNQSESLCGKRSEEALRPATLLLPPIA